MSYSRLDLPLWDDPASKFSPWLMSLLVYLATVAFLIALSVHVVIDRWDKETSHKLTIEIPPSTQSFDHLAAPFSKNTSQDVCQYLTNYAGIKTFRVANRAEVIKTLEPWFGDSEGIKDLPISTLIYVQLEPGKSFDVMSLQKRLNEKFENIHVEDHYNWKKGIFHIAYAVQIISFLIVTLIFLSIVAMVSYMTRASLIIHRNIVNILHLIGARNAYIAKQYQSHTLKIALRGSFVGVVFSALTLLGFDNIMSQLDFPMLMKILSVWDVWAIVFFIPTLITLLMTYSAKVTAFKMLKKIAY